MVPMSVGEYNLTFANRCRAARRRRRGFVLLMALVLIALAGLLLVGLARHSLEVTAESQQARAELQRRWGVVFLSRAVLAKPEELLTRFVDPHRPLPRQFPVQANLHLGEIEFTLTLDDENRKLNLNRVRDTRGTNQLIEFVAQRTSGSLVLDLQPLRGSAFSTAELDSWGHVVQIPAAGDRLQHHTDLEKLTRVATLWGSATINTHRCDDEVLRYVGQLAAGPVVANRLVSIRNDNPRLTTEEVLDRLALQGRKLSLLRGWLSDTSDTYSLWIVGRDRRNSLDLYVCGSSGGDTYDTRHFQW